MANMSYCRWQNTYLDLADCADSMYERAIEDPSEWEELSREEKSARRNLFFTMADMLEELGVELSHNELENALDALERTEEDSARAMAESEEDAAREMAEEDEDDAPLGQPSVPLGCDENGKKPQLVEEEE